jgi:hypothetical protein
MPWPWPIELKWGGHPAYYDTDTMGRYWRWVTNGAIDPTGGYLGGPCLTFDESGGFTTTGTPPIGEDPNIATVFPGDWGAPVTDPVHLFMGGRFEVDSYPAARTLIYAPLNVEQFVQCMLAMETDGRLAVYRSIGGAAVQLWLSTDPLDLGLHRLGFLVGVNQINGWFDLYVDGSHWIYKPNLDTAQHDLTAWAGVGFGGSEAMRHSHMFLFQGVPEYNDGVRQGGLFARYLPVTGNGALEEWETNTLSIAAAVDDPAPDDEATAIAPEASNSDFTVEVDELPITRNIYGVQVDMVYQRTDATGNALRPLVLLDGATYLGENVGGSEDWSVVRKVWTKNPATGTPWSRTRLNAAEWGGRAL